jgi:hypothetical protein
MHLPVKEAFNFFKGSWFLSFWQYSSIIIGKNHYEGDKKYFRRCEIYLFHDSKSCPFGGISPIAGKDKEKIKQNQHYSSK